MSDHRNTRRAHEPWNDDEYSLLVDELRQGKPIEDIASRMQRSRSAVQARIRLLVPASVKGELPLAEQELWLRGALAETEPFDWRSVLKDSYAINGWRFWSAQDEEDLRWAWSRRQALPAVAEQLGASEVQVALRLCQLGLADSVGDVVERLGATPGNTVAIRALMAADRAAASVWVLVVDGAGSEVAAFDGQRRHVSIHGSYDSAQERLAELRTGAEARGHGPLMFSVAQRTADEDTYGATTHEVMTLSGQPG